MRSPKRATDGSNNWYRYYAGYSRGFVEDALASLELGDSATILDPWNGSGTTTAVAHERGYRTIGYDANPVLVLIARARLLGAEVADSLSPLAEDILGHGALATDIGPREPDALEAWLDRNSARRARAIERAIRYVLIDPADEVLGTPSPPLERTSALAAFFYVALFDTIRTTLRPFVTSNPTWVKIARAGEQLAAARDQLEAAFRSSVTLLSGQLHDYRGTSNTPTVEVATSSRLPLGDGEVNGVITSPPYCTRIDYVAATRPELAVLGLVAEDVRALRETMVGTPTITAETPEVAEDWGSGAASLVRAIAAHKSRASGGYYRKYFVQYFDGLWRSLKELQRVVRAGGPAVIVVQDSYYKDIHIDLPAIVQEMGERLGWTTSSRVDFEITRTKAGIHPGTRSWRTDFSAVEAAITLA
jgi:SAM-dependent methyltransferase